MQAPEAAFEQSQAGAEVEWSVGSGEDAASEAGEPACPHVMDGEV